MADKKISALTAAATPLDGTEVLPIVQSGATVKVANNDLRPKQIQSNATSGVLQVVGPASAATRVITVPNANFTAARTDAAQSFTGDQTLSTGNIIQGTAAKGFNFTANTPAAGKTSQLLNWYEEGTWDVDIEGATTAGTNTNLVRYATYTRIGRQVTVNFYVRWESATGTGTLLITGLPFTSRNEAGYFYSGGMGYTNLAYTAGNTPVLYLTHNRTKIDVNQLVPGSAAIGVPVPATGLIIGQITYFT